MKFRLVAFSALMIIVLSCKKSETRSGKICFTRTVTELKIENNTNNKFYFTAFGQNILPVINWSPVCNDNLTVSGNTSLHKDLSEILGYSNNDLLVIYYWKCTDNNHEQIESITLDKNQTVCK